MLVAALDTRAAVEAIDLGVMICGGLCALGFVFWLIRRGEWRNPLAGVRAAALWRVAPAPMAGFPGRPGAGHQPEVEQSAEPGRAELPSLPAARLTLGPQGPTLLHIAIALAAYAIVSQLAVAAFLAGQDLQAATQPGTRTWVLMQAADTLAKLLVSLLVIFMLARNSLFPRDAAVPRIIRKAGIGLLTGLILAPNTLVQLQMSSAIWQWLHPAQTLPVHPVLLALKESTMEPWGPAVLAIAAIVVAPLGEELLFRGLVLGAVWRLTGRAWLSVVISGVLFGAIHGQPQDILPLCTMGVILGYVRLRTRSLVPPITAHALFNARTMIMALLFPETIGS
jgi:membrane protease YdiL (CAAX protease family)